MSHDTKQTQIMTIAGRWRHHAAASGMVNSMSTRDQTLAMLMFYAGFSAALDAMLEVADVASDDRHGARLIEALRRESELVAATAMLAVQTPAATGGH